MRRSAFTLLELIFVIVIIGILAKIGVQSIHTDYLLNDANYIAAKLRQAQYRGIGYDHRWGSGQDVSGACVTLTKTALEENASLGKVHYRLHVTLEDSDLKGKTVCFDHLGEAHDDGSFTSEAIAEQNVLTLSYGGRMRDIILLPKSGYVIIK